MQIGQVFTPKSISDLMVEWIIINKPQTILDPAVGQGIFFKSILEKYMCKFIGFDIDPLMIEQASKIKNISLFNENFLTTDKKCKSDSIICNPPYANFHDFDRNLIKIINSKFKTSFSQLTNLYALFFIKAWNILNENGHMVFITPTEFFYTGYGKILKQFLLDKFTIDVILVGDLQKSLFSNACTTSAITFLKKAPAPIHHKVKLRILNEKSFNTVLQKDLVADSNWLIHIQKEIINCKNLIHLSEIAKVKRGIATGSNDFFTLSKDDAQNIEKQFLKPVISKTNQIQKIIFNNDDWKHLLKTNHKAYLLDIRQKPSKNLLSYIDKGITNGVDKRYLCQHRNPWYSVENRNQAPILASVFSRDRMLFIYNKSKCVNLTAFHGIYPNFTSPIMIKSLLAYLNSSICKKIQKYNRREYGGGLHKFEPSDLAKLPVLNVINMSKQDLNDLSKVFDEFCTTNNSKKMDIKINSILNYL